MGVRILGFLLGGLSLLYFAVYAVFAGLTNTFTYFWLLLGGFCILLAAGWKRAARILRAVPMPVKAVGGVLCGLCVLALGAAEIFIISYGSRAPQPGADYVLVLGAQVRGRTPSYNLARRLDAALGYLLENPGTKAILSGGQGPGEEISEAQAMAEYLEEKGISKERMILEDASVNTYENISFSRAKMEGENPRVVLVTNNFHVYRSVGIARKQGLTRVEGLGASVMWYTVPNLYLREAFAVIKYKLWGQI